MMAMSDPPVNLPSLPLLLLGYIFIVLVLRMHEEAPFTSAFASRLPYSPAAAAAAAVTVIGQLQFYDPHYDEDVNVMALSGPPVTASLLPLLLLLGGITLCSYCNCY